MDFSQPAVLGRTGLQVGRLGVAASYGAPSRAFEEAFERGCNYFYWGSMRKSGMLEAIRNICKKGKRDELVIVVQSYSRSAALMEVFFARALRTLGMDSADVLLLGWHNKRPSGRLMERALSMKEKGMYRFLGMSGHNRMAFPELAREGHFDLFHIRYNAAHRGAEEESFAPMEGDGRPGIVSYTATRWGQLLSGGKMPEGEEPPRASDCYRFAMSHPTVDVCMSGPKDLSQMHEALKAIDLGPLSEEEMKRMRRIGDHVHQHGRKFF